MLSISYAFRVKKLCCVIQIFDGQDFALKSTGFKFQIEEMRSSWLNIRSTPTGIISHSWCNFVKYYTDYNNIILCK